MWDYIAARGLRAFKTTTEWVKVEILAQGNRVRTALKGVVARIQFRPDHGGPYRSAIARLARGAGGAL